MVDRRNSEFFQVLGLVNCPNLYELPVNQDLRVLDAIAVAEGVSVPVADRVQIIRRVPGESTSATIEVSIKEAMRNENENLRIAAGRHSDRKTQPEHVSVGHLSQRALGDRARNNCKFKR